MNDPTTWTVADLATLVTAREPENLTLEFKASAALAKDDKKRNDLSKDISGMANAAGGVIVYGIVEHEHHHVADHLDDGSDPREIGPEWIEQVANSRIHPRIEGLAVRLVSLGEATDGRVAYVAVVPQSHTAHMASDHRYYKRRGTTVEPMEDYEVRDVMARGSTPLLQLVVTTSPVAGAPLTLEVNLSIENEAVIPAEWCVMQVVVPQPLRVISDGGANGTQEVTSDHGWPVTALRFQYGGLNQMPIWQGLSMNPRPPNARPLQVVAPHPASYLLGWRITAPGMAWRSGETVLTFPAASP